MKRLLSYSLLITVSLQAVPTFSLSRFLQRAVQPIKYFNRASIVNAALPKMRPMMNAANMQKTASLFNQRAFMSTNAQQQSNDRNNQNVSWLISWLNSLKNIAKSISNLWYGQKTRDTTNNQKARDDFLTAQDVRNILEEDNSNGKRSRVSEWRKWEDLIDRMPLSECNILLLDIKKIMHCDPLYTFNPFKLYESCDKNTQDIFKKMLLEGLNDVLNDKYFYTKGTPLPPQSFPKTASWEELVVSFYHKISRIDKTFKADAYAVVKKYLDKKLPVDSRNPNRVYMFLVNCLDMHDIVGKYFIKEECIVEKERNNDMTSSTLPMDLLYADDYQVLGITSKATKDDIKKAYRVRAFAWHPDKNPNERNAAEALMKRLNKAYEVLK